MTGLNLWDPALYSLLAPLFKPTWHSALHPEEQEIKVRGTLVCWADLLPPRCYLIIQELWNVPLYGSMQPECLCLPLMTLHSLSFHLSMRVCVQCESALPKTNGHTQTCQTKHLTQIWHTWSSNDGPRLVERRQENERKNTKHRAHVEPAARRVDVFTGLIWFQTAQSWSGAHVGAGVQPLHKQTITCNYTILLAVMSLIFTV